MVNSGRLASFGEASALHQVLPHPLDAVGPSTSAALVCLGQVAFGDIGEVGDELRADVARFGGAAGFIYLEQEREPEFVIALGWQRH